MSELSSKFSRDDIETLLESIGDWEMVGNQEFHILQMIKNVPMPPEDHEAYNAMHNVKDYFKKREKEILKSREVRQERAIFLKAKLMLVRKDIGISKLFDMASAVDLDTVLTPKHEKESTESGEGAIDKKADDLLVLKKKLELAEFFIEDLGVSSHYKDFLLQKSKKENMQ